MVEGQRDTRLMKIDSELVRGLISSQFPEWGDLPVVPVKVSGWDNRNFHLGSDMIVRLPSAAAYAPQVEKEHLWLPRLAPLLPVAIPEPIALGSPAFNYPWHWSIYRWIDGETVDACATVDLNLLAFDLAKFLRALQAIDPQNGPLSGAHNFYRGASISVYDEETRGAIAALKNRIDAALAIKIWERGMASSWDKDPVWVHGDVSAGNLLINEGRLTAVIDFGLLSIGDPACDLVMAWTVFDDVSRKIFRETLPLDQQTWDRARAWALWKSLIVMLDPDKSNAVEAKQSLRTYQEIVADSASM